MNKVLMIGLDGATFTLLEPLMADDVMPFLKKFVSEGVYGDLMSTPNPLTPPAWVSMYTGRSPSVHGIHDFLRPETTGKDVFLKVNDSRDIQCETGWSIASRQGKRVTALNFYGMSPPSPVDGNIISGFVPWKHLRSATYPSNLFDTLKSLPNFNYKNLGMDISEEKKCIQGLEADESKNWIEVHSERGKAWGDALCHLMQTDPTDLTAIVFDGPDKLQHLFWRYLDPALVEPNPSPFDAQIRELCLNPFRELDAIIERLVFLAGPETNVVMTSDHGFGATTEVVYVNEWLAQHGYLKWADEVEVDSSGKLTADRMKEHLTMIDWKNTVAYCPTPSSNAIYIKRANNSSKGVKDEDYLEFCTKLKQQLLEYRNPADGGQVFIAVNLNNLNGANDCKNSPDITLNLRDYGFVSILKSTEVVIPREKPDGTHRPNGIFIARGPDVEAGQKIEPLSILDITPLLLYFLGLPIPTDLEGRVPTEILCAKTLMNHPVKCQGLTKSLHGEVSQQQEISDEEKGRFNGPIKVTGLHGLTAMPYLVVDNVTIHYQCLGEGENLVLIHGLGANLAFWYPGIASMLSQHYRVILYDLRGHGKSDMPAAGYALEHMTHDLHALLEHLGVERVHVAGHSFGARVGLYYAISHPQRVATLTLADTQFKCLQPKVRLREWSYWETWKQQLQQQGVPLPSEDEFISFQLLKHLNQVSDIYTQGSQARKTRSPSLKTRNMGQKGTVRWNQLMEATTAKQEFEEGELITPEDIQKIAVPTLAVYGEYSHCLPSCWKLKELIEDCQVIVHPDVGHFHPVIQQDLFVQTLCQFLQNFVEPAKIFVRAEA